MTTGSRVLLALVATVGMGNLPYCYAQGSGSITNPPACEVDTLTLWVGKVSYNMGDDPTAREAMLCLMGLWMKRDGHAGDYISDAFLAVMADNPPIFFETMASEPTIFSAWLSDLQDRSFTWDMDPPCRLESKRRQLIMILQHTAIPDRKASALRNAVKTKLSTLRCRQIN